MRTLYIAIAALVAVLTVVAPAAAPNRPDRPQCPEGYTEHPDSTSKAVLCTKETVREVVKTVPGPERVVERTVEVFGNPTCPTGTMAKVPATSGAIVCIERVEVPGPERIVTRTVTKTKVKIVKVKSKPKIVRTTKFIRYCPKPPNGDKIAG